MAAQQGVEVGVNLCLAKSSICLVSKPVPESSNGCSISRYMPTRQALDRTPTKSVSMRTSAFMHIVQCKLHSENMITHGYIITRGGSISFYEEALGMELPGSSPSIQAIHTFTAAGTLAGIDSLLVMPWQS